MEGKVIFYIVGGIFYFIYTYYKNKLEQGNKPDYNTPKPVVKTAFDELMEQVKKVSAPAPMPKPEKKEVAKQEVFKSKDIFVHEKPNPHFEEGKSAYKIFDEAIYEEGGSKVIPISEIITEEADNHTLYNFNLRDAVIQSIVLERKY